MYSFDPHRADAPLLHTARSMVDELQAAQADIHEHSEIPEPIITALAEQGFFRMLLPESLQGFALDPETFVRIVETLAYGDGSTAWCICQASVFGNMAESLNADLREEIWGSNPHARVATGVPKYASAIQEHPDHFTVSGHWRFASGIKHITWLAAVAPVVDHTENATSNTANNSAPPQGKDLMFLIPAEQVERIANWNVEGLRGTGSDDYRVDALPVPAHRTLPWGDFGRHTGSATGLDCPVLFGSGFGATGLGIARRAIDTLKALATEKVPVFGNAKLADDALVQTGLAQAIANYESARSFLLDACLRTQHARSSITGGKSSAVPVAERNHLRLAATHAMRTSGKVVDQIYALAGTDGMFHEHPLHRCFQDIHALTQQVQARPSHYKNVGRYLLGRVDLPV